MRVICMECYRQVGSYVYLGYDEDGHGVIPVCDSCAGIPKAA